MTQLQEIAHLPASELRRLIGRRELSPVEVVEACLSQIEQHNPRLNAICTVNERALDEARQAEQALMKGNPPGLLHGLPVGIKDVTHTAGLRTTFGSTVYADYIPQSDALVVERVKKAGGIILGKTNTSEFGAGANTVNEVFGKTRNPWNPDLTAGGSTGGGAVGLATGMIALAQGADLGGSLRIPASFCGVVGLRPSPGLAPTYPAGYLWDTLQVTGPMARTAEDVALMLQAICGPSPRSPLAQATAGRDFVAAVRAGVPASARIAYSPDIAGIGIDPEIERICRQAAFGLAQSGAGVEEIELDLSFGWPHFLALRGYRMVAEHYEDLDKIDRFGSNLASNLRSGLQFSMESLGAAEHARTRIWHMFYDFFQKFDYLLTPCMAIPPFPVEQPYPRVIGGKEMKTYVDWVAPTFLLSLTGLPVGCVPCGLTADRLPVGLQIVGPFQGEEAVLALARQIQESYPVGLP